MRLLQLHFCVLFACFFCARAQAGYTHYFTWNAKPDEAALKACIGEMRRVIEARTNILAGDDGTNAMIIDPLHVDFNGRGDDANEPFVFPGEQGFNFCKTEFKPYDAVVAACLLVARDHFPSSVLSIDSDGSWSEGDWDEGKKLYSSVLGRAPKFPMSPLWRVIGWRYALWAYVATAFLLLVAILLLRKLIRRL